MASVSESLPPQPGSDPWLPWLNRAETAMRTITHTGVLAPTGYAADWLANTFVFPGPSEDELAQERALPDAAIANNMLRQKGMLPGPISPGVARDGTVWTAQGSAPSQTTQSGMSSAPNSTGSSLIDSYLATAPNANGANAAVDDPILGLDKWGGRGLTRTMEDGSTASIQVYRVSNITDEWSKILALGPEAVMAKKRELRAAGLYGNAVPTMSVALDESDLNAMAQAMTLGNINSLSYEDVIAPRVQWSRDNGGKPYTGEDPNDPNVQARDREQKVRFSADFENAAASIRQFAWDNGLTFTEDFIGKKAQAIALGEESLDNVVGFMRTQVAKTYPGFGEQINAGYSVRDLADPYIGTASQLLEINPNDLSLNDPLIRKALEGTGQSDSGMPLWKFEELARADERWQYTDNARDQIVGSMMDLGRLMGFEG